MNKQQMIDDFLKYWRDVAQENPELDFEDPNFHDIIYHQLVRLGVPKQEQQQDVSYMFPKWIEQFSRNPNIQVFVDPNHAYFCQFVSNHEDLCCYPEALKVYVPQDLAHLETSANMIFNFLSRYNIPHQSKVGKAIRNDNIVIRLIRPEDADLLKYFIRNNSYIQEGMLPTNPFDFSENGISFACDGKLSFHEVISQYIRLYIANRKKNQKLSQVGVDDFYHFMSEYYQDTFIQLNNLEQFHKDFSLPFLPTREDSKQIINYLNVTSLLFRISDPKFNYQDLLQHYDTCSDLGYQGRLISNLEQMQNKGVKKENPLQDTNKLLLEFYQSIIKDKPVGVALATIQDYIYTGNPIRVTRTNNLRERIMNSTFIRDMRKVLLEQNLTLAQYIQKVSNVQATQLPEDYSPEKMEQLVIAVVKNLEKQVGLQMTIEYLQTYLYSSQEFRLMLPEQLKRQISTIGFKSHLLGLLMEQNTDVKGYIQKLMQEGKLDFNKKLYLDNAILETYQKFETLYQNGSQPIPGRNFVQSSMQQFLKTGEYTGFTKNNNARQNLIDNVSWQDVVNLTRDALSLPQNKPLTDQEISLISYQYTEGVIQNYYDQLKQRA